MIKKSRDVLKTEIASDVLPLFHKTTKPAKPSPMIRITKTNDDIPIISTRRSS